MTTWKFEQLGPNPKTLYLEGYSAPFGRPRQDPVLNEVIELRIQTTKYPGSKGPPTRHAFGSGWEDMELRGRWSTRHLSASTNESQPSSAGEMVNAWTEFVRDEFPVRFSWGNIATYKGIIWKISFAREGQHDVAWRMSIKVDAREDALLVWGIQQPPATEDQFAELNAFVRESSLTQLEMLPDMQPDFFDQLDFFAGQLNQPAALLNRIAGDMAEIEKQSFATIAHFRNAISGMKSAIAQMRETIINASIDGVVAVRSAEAEVSWQQYQLAFDLKSTTMLFYLDDMDLTLELVQTGKASKIVTAVEGDTWETLAYRGTGGIGVAAQIRGTAGGRYGEQPRPGEQYLVP